MVLVQLIEVGCLCVLCICASVYPVVLLENLVDIYSISVVIADVCIYSASTFEYLNTKIEGNDGSLEHVLLAETANDSGKFRAFRPMFNFLHHPVGRMPQI